MNSIKKPPPVQNLPIDAHSSNENSEEAEAIKPCNKY